MRAIFTICLALITMTSFIQAQSPNPIIPDSYRIPADATFEKNDVLQDDFSSVTSPTGVFLGSSFPSPPGGSVSLFAPPANDNCANATNLTVNGACINGTTKEATIQVGETFGCQGTPTQSVWYRFTATSANMFAEIEWTASSGCYFSSAVYSNASCLPATRLSCEDAAGGPLLNIHNLTGLTVGNSYLIQVSYTAGGPCGGTNGPGAVNTGADFCIKVGTTVNCGTCNNPCGPMCIFPSAPTVAQVTSTCTQYQLQSRLNVGQTRTQCYTFTAMAVSFSLQMIINTVGCSGGNVTTFNWTLYPSTCIGVVQSGTLANLNATGLTIGAGYVLCYTWTAACQHNSVYPYMVATAPLPVELVHFSGKTNSKSILLDWVTASEINNNYFSVQRSRNGSDFTEIGIMEGAGNSNNPIEYTFVDLQPMPGINYYRLVQVDYDQTMAYSETIAVRYQQKYHVELHSNIANESLNLGIHAESEGTIGFMILSPDGKVIMTEFKACAEGMNLIELSMNGLAAGIYHLKITGYGQETHQRFVKL